MKGKKIITISIIINIILIDAVCNLLNKIILNESKQIIKEMTEMEYEEYITGLNQSHEDYANYIEESKKTIASAITDMGIETLETSNAETMANNIRNIQTNKDASSINYNNIDSGLTSTNVQEALDEINNNLEWKKIGTIAGSSSLELPNNFKEICAISQGMIINIPYNVLTDTLKTFRTSTFNTNTYYIGHLLFSVSISKDSIKINQICSINYPSLGASTSGEYKDLSSTSSMDVYYK